MKKNKLQNLYELADKKSIPVDENCPECIVSMSVRLKNGKKIISVAPPTVYESDLPNSDRPYTKLECLAHEMGHCMTDSFYAGYSPLELRTKHEHRANKWAIEYLIPFTSLCDAVAGGHREIWELAEYFNVSCAFVEKAIKSYAQYGRVVPNELYTD